MSVLEIDRPKTKAKKENVNVYERFAIQWIAGKYLKIHWPNAQRPFDEPHAKHLADTFDPDLLDALLVTPVGGGFYHIIAGQHRWGAVRMLWGDNEKLPCRVIPDCDEKRAAHIFIEDSLRRKKPHAVHIFQNAVTAGYEVECAVDKIVRRLGYKVGISATEGVINAPAALLGVYKSHGSKTLQNTLEVLQATFGKDHHGVAAQLIRGYGAFLAEYPKASWQRLVERVQRKFTPGRLIGASRVVMESWHVTAAAAVKEVLIGTYNHGLKNGKLERK